MATSIRKGAKPHLYITEHREAAGLTLDQVGGRVGVERNTVWRWENDQKRLNPIKIASLAHAIGVEPEDFWRPPVTKERPSLDAIAKDATDTLHQTLVDVVRRLARQAS